MFLELILKPKNENKISINIMDIDKTCGLIWRSVCNIDEIIGIS